MKNPDTAKKRNLLPPLLLSMLILSASLACKKESASPEKEEEPTPYPTEALAENDNSKFGIYRGVIRNKHGAGQLKMNLYNGSDQAMIVIAYENTLDTLHSVLSLTRAQWTDGIQAVEFKGQRFHAFVSLTQPGFAATVQVMFLPEYQGEPVTDYKIFLGRTAKERSFEKVHALIGTFTPDPDHAEGNTMRAGTFDGLLCERTDPVNPRYQLRAILMEEDAEHSRGLGTSFQTNEYTRPENALGNIVSLNFQPPTLTGSWELREGSGTFEAKIIDWF